LCKETSYLAKGDPINPHLCSCTMCQKSSGSPTVAWVEFLLKDFNWSLNNHLGLYRSSEKTQRCFCKNCGSFLGAIDDEGDSIFITIASLNNPNLIVPSKEHSYEEEGPAWWRADITVKNKRKTGNE